MSSNRYLTIMDFADRKVETEIDLSRLDEIESIYIDVVSGDEIAIVYYKDGRTRSFDSAEGTRIVDFEDGSYLLYDCDMGINRIKEFERRDDSYDVTMLWED